jgi:hypothetical protein
MLLFKTLSLQAKSFPLMRKPGIPKRDITEKSLNMPCSTYEPAQWNTPFDIMGSLLPQAGLPPFYFP